MAAEAETSDPELMAKALRFRTELGLDSSINTITTLAETTAPSITFGIPLTAAEEALMVERGRIQQGLAPLRDYRDEHRDTWGGLWLSYPLGGTLDHAVTVNVGLTSPTIRSLARLAHDTARHRCG